MTEQDKALIRKIEQDIKALDDKHNFDLGYWGNISSKSVRVEQCFDKFRVILRFWEKIKEDDEGYRHGVGFRNEREIGGMSLVIPRDYDIDMVGGQFLAIQDSRHK